MKKILSLILFALLLLPLEGQGIIRANPFYSYIQRDTLGSEMLSNGGFNDGTDWVIVANWSISGGVATYDDIANGNIYQLTEDMLHEVEPNTTYRVTLDVSISSGDANFRFTNINNAVVYVDYANYANGSHVIRFTTPADVGLKGFLIRAQALSSATFSLDNISMKKVL